VGVVVMGRMWRGCVDECGGDECVFMLVWGWRGYVTRRYWSYIEDGSPVERVILTSEWRVCRILRGMLVRLRYAEGM